MTLALHSPTPGLFEQWWQQQGEWVEEPNNRRGGCSGVQRIRNQSGELLYAKRQVGHIYRSLLHPFGRPTVLRELRALTRLKRIGVNVPQVVYCGAARDADNIWRALLVTADFKGFIEIDQWRASGGRERHGEAFHQKVMEAVGVMIARMNNVRWQHNCLYSKHVFIRVDGEGEQATFEVGVLDLEKSRPRLTRKQAARHDLRQLRRHSSWSDADWQHVIYGHSTAFGSAIKGL
ncbi:MAG: lipopolysaccharide kinase InaA family protein [Pseudomonas sp.]|uniref:lipopolysaccharide kinase InaA family protein n=1 Tax=Pseudomonas sp. TaxID=306 RepID=UPI0030F14B05